MDWNAVASDLEAIAETCGISALDYVPDDLPNKCLYIGEMDIEPNQTMNSVDGNGRRRGTDQGVVTLRLLIARSTDKHSIRKMREFLAGGGTNSLIQAIQATNNQSATYAWSGIKVQSMRGNRLFNVGEAKFYGTEIDVFVIGAA